MKKLGIYEVVAILLTVAVVFVLGMAVGYVKKTKKVFRPAEENAAVISAII